MSAICDCHVHFYPTYDISLALEMAWTKLETARVSAELPSKTTKILCLTERHDCFFFDELINKLPEGDSPSTYKIRPTKENCSLRLELMSKERHGSERRELIIVAGRQIVTSERIEVLALASNLRLADGLSFSEVYQQIQQANGICAINWAPGKWFFRRGEIIRSLIASKDFPKLFLGDTTLRPTIWPKPNLMRRGESLGRKILSGSDPLPPRGEEDYIGSYGIVVPEIISAEYPAKSLRDFLLSSTGPFTTFGKRGSSVEVFWRIFKHEYLAFKNKH